MNFSDQRFETTKSKYQSHFEKSYLSRFGGAKECPECLPTLTPEIIEKKREMDKTNEDLDYARNKMEEWKTRFQKKQKEIEEKKVILENQKKQLRIFADHHASEIKEANRKEALEREKINTLKKRIEELNIELENTTNKNKDLIEQVTRLKKYSSYLNTVISRDKTYENIGALLNRYEILKTTKEEYLKKFNDIMNQLGKDEERMSQEIIKKKRVLLARSMELSRSKQTIENVNKNNQIKKTEMCKNVQRTEIKNTELAEINSAILTIFKRAYKKSITNAQKSTIRSEPTLQEMMLFIKNRFKDLEGILNDVGA